jgi:hypothetical protein
VEPEETSITRQWIGKHVSATKANSGSIIDRRCFPLGPPRGYVTRNSGRLKELRIPEGELRVGSSVVKKKH